MQNYLKPSSGGDGDAIKANSTVVWEDRSGPTVQDRLRVDTATSPGSGEPGSGRQTRSRSTATVMSPRTLDVVRQRSRNQSTVSRMGIFSAGRRTAANIKGSVTKLPEGMLPAPTLATRVVSMMTTWSTRLSE